MSHQRISFLPRTRCTNHERLIVETKAKEAGLSLSEYQRRASLDGLIISKEPLADIQLILALKKLGKEINAIGKNVHQITRTANIHGDIDIVRFDRLSGELSARLSTLDTALTSLGL